VIRRAAALLLLGCDLTTHPPNLLELCPRVEVAAYTAEAGCVRLQDTNGMTLFRLSTSESCGGPPCLLLEPGQTGYALEKIRPSPDAEWFVEHGPCAELAAC
jgi:hypothetical protein